MTQRGNECDQDDGGGEGRRQGHACSRRDGCSLIASCVFSMGRVASPLFALGGSSAADSSIDAPGSDHRQALGHNDRSCLSRRKLRESCRSPLFTSEIFDRGIDLNHRCLDARCIDSAAAWQKATEMIFFLSLVLSTRSIT